MMYFLLILFFGSLTSIIFMIGRKLMVLQNGHIFQEDTPLEESPYLEEWKDATVRNIKKYSYFGLVATIRLYFRSSNFLKKKYTEAKIKIKDLLNKKSDFEETEKREVNGFLKMISEYKHKIRNLKRQIKEEEEENVL